MLAIRDVEEGHQQVAADRGGDEPEPVLAPLAQDLALDVATGVRRSLQTGYRTGLRLRWLAGDLDALLLILTRTREQLQLPASHPGRLRVLWDWLHFFGRDVHYEIESLDVPAPARLEWRLRLRTTLPSR